MAEVRRHKFTRAMRLRRDREFAAVFAGRCRKSLGPIAVLGVVNGLGHHRLGLSVGRRVGTAVERHRVKRLLREAFRLDHQDWPGALDLVVVVYPHGVLPLAAYRRMLGSGAASVWRRLGDVAEREDR